MADNSIKIKTEIQTRQAEVQLATLENQMLKTAAKAEKLRSSMKELEGKHIETKEYQENYKEIAKLGNELEKLVEKRDQMIASDKTESQSFVDLVSRITELKDALKNANAEAKQLRENGQEFTLGKDTDEYAKLEEQLRNVESEMDIQAQKHDILTDKMENNAKTASKLATALSKAKKVLAGLGSIISKGFKSTSNTLKTSFLSILKYVIGVQALFALFKKLKSVAADAFKEMAKQVPEVNSSISSMQQAMNGLKASVGTMLQPLLVAVSGLVTQIINKVTQLATAIGGLFARLTGQNYVYKATAAQVDYAKSLDKTGKSAKKTSKQLAAFDELNVINTQDDSSGGGGATPTATYAKEMIPDGIKNIADTLKDMWNNADFTGLGAMLGQKLKTALYNIDWGPIQEVGKKIGKSLATFINGFFEVENLGSDLGYTVAQAFNTVIYTVQSFLQNLHSFSIGKFFADWISEGWTTLDWNALANTISLAVSNIMDLLIGLLQNLRVEEIGGAIADFLQGIDWFRLATELMVLIYEAIIAVVNIIIGLIAGLSDLFADGFRALGLDSIAGFFEGLSEKLKEGARLIRQFFKDYVLDPIRELFGIHSPSTVFAQLGRYCIEGMLNGIRSLIGTVVTLFANAWNNIKSTTITIWESIKSSILNIFSSIWNGIKNVINSILGGIETMANGIVNGVNRIIDTMNNLSFDIPEWIPEFGGKSIGFNIPRMSTISIPKLAQGAVIPPNREFMAVLGDQKNGTNIEAPLDTIKEALRETLSQYGSDNGDIVVQIDGYEVFRAVRKQSRIFKNSTGVAAF